MQKKYQGNIKGNYEPYNSKTLKMINKKGIKKELIEEIFCFDTFKSPV